jgi:hypothetical protein
VLAYSAGLGPGWLTILASAISQLTFGTLPPSIRAGIPVYVLAISSSLLMLLTRPREPGADSLG